MTLKIPGLRCKKTMCHWNRLMVESAENKTVIRDKACFLKVFLTCLQILTYDVIASERQFVSVFNSTNTHNLVLLKFAQLGLEMTVTRRPIHISD